MLEGAYQTILKKKIESLLPGSIVIKNDPEVNFQGIPDLVVLYDGFAATLEVKISATAEKQPNQDYYMEQFGKQTIYAAFIYPENQKEILHALQQAFATARSSCLPWSE